MSKFFGCIAFIFMNACNAYQMADLSAPIYVAGHTGLVGSAIVRALEKDGYTHIITRSHQELDLCDAQAVDAFFQAEKPEYVFLAAAKVGGILANSTYPADFIRINLAISLNVINAAYNAGVKKVLYLGSSCIYPRDCPQPMKEEYLLSGPLEPTNKPYAVAKIAGIELCKAYNEQYPNKTRFIACMPTNLYGPGDNFNLNTSHVLPALLAKIYNASQEKESEFVVWGTGKPRREFLYVDDLADACLFLMKHYDGNEIVNVGTGVDITILELVDLIKDVVGYKGTIVFDTTKPDGTPQKLLDMSVLHNLGWHAQVGLKEGIQKTLQWYLSSK